MCCGKRKPETEFVHADDLADACALLFETDTSGLQLPLNVGSGSDLSIQHLAELVAAVVGYRGLIEWDATRPDGAPRKLLDSRRLHAAGWSARIALQAGVAETYAWYQRNVMIAEAVS